LAKGKTAVGIIHHGGGAHISLAALTYLINSYGSRHR
jgi:hypothetical protein